MPNWFEDHPARSIIVYTLTIAAATWACSTFVVDERRVNYYKAEAENSETMAKQYQAKVSVLELENRNIREENQTYRRWLESQPTSFPALAAKIKQLEDSQPKQPCTQSGQETAAKTVPAQAPNAANAGPYSSKGVAKEGETFTDSHTGVNVGVAQVTVDQTAKIILNLPGKQQQVIPAVMPGMQWPYSYRGSNYELLVKAIHWIGSSVEFQIDEQSKSNR